MFIAREVKLIRWGRATIKLFVDESAWIANLGIGSLFWEHLC